MSRLAEYVPALRGKVTQTVLDVCTKKQTEAPFSANYDAFRKQPDREYLCAICEQRLFEPGQRFESSCGWPAFGDAAKGAVALQDDSSHGMQRTEALCANCGAHLGHLFIGERGPGTQRYCINAVSLAWRDDGGAVRRFEQETRHQ